MAFLKWKTAVDATVWTRRKYEKESETTFVGKGFSARRLVHTVATMVVLGLNSVISVWTLSFGANIPDCDVNIWRHQNNENDIIAIALWMSSKGLNANKMESDDTFTFPFFF